MRIHEFVNMNSQNQMIKNYRVAGCEGLMKKTKKKHMHQTNTNLALLQWSLLSDLTPNVQKQLPRSVLRKVVLKNFAKFIGKPLCQSLSFNKVPGFRLWWLFLHILQKQCSIKIDDLLKTAVLQNNCSVAVKIFNFYRAEAGIL